MTDIRYLAPHTLDEAISAYADAAGAARILAGGTDLLVQMRSGMVSPGLILDIKKISELTEITETSDGGFRIGAAVSGAVLAEHPRFGEVWPGGGSFGSIALPYWARVAPVGTVGSRAASAERSAKLASKVWMIGMSSEGPWTNLFKRRGGSWKACRKSLEDPWKTR